MCLFNSETEVTSESIINTVQLVSQVLDLAEKCLEDVALFVVAHGTVLLGHILEANQSPPAQSLALVSWGSSNRLIVAAPKSSTIWPRILIIGVANLTALRFA